MQKLHSVDKENIRLIVRPLSVCRVCVCVGGGIVSLSQKGVCHVFIWHTSVLHLACYDTS